MSKIRWVELVSSAVQGSGSSREDKSAKALARGMTVREQMAAAEGGNMSAEDAARQLNTTKQTVLNMYHRGRLLGWKSSKQGAIRFPVWQFDGSDVLEGLEQVLEKLTEAEMLDDWGKIGFFLQTHGTLEDRRPLDLLREHDADAVMHAAEAYAA